MMMRQTSGMVRYWKGGFISLGLLSLMLDSSLAAITMDRTRVIYEGDQKAISVSVANKNKSLPYLAQAWLEDEDGNKISSPFLVTPPLQRIEAAKESQVKIQALPQARQLPQDRESIYYFNLREIPPKSDKPNSLQIALQTRVKFFYRPETIKIDQDNDRLAQKISLEKQGDRYLVKNNSPYYFTIVDGSDMPDKFIADDFEPLMLAPFSEGKLAVSAAKLGAKPVLTYVNDFGARPQIIFECSANLCTGKPTK